MYTEHPCPKPFASMRTSIRRSLKLELAKHGYAGLPLEPEEEIDLGSFTIGAIAALGALALIHLLTKDKKD
jgi:hypothetical protein